MKSAALGLALAALPALGFGSPPTADQIGRARAHFQRGQQYYAENDFPRAAVEFEAAYRLVPGPELAYNAARTYERMSDFRQAIAYYRRYLEDPSAQEFRAEVERKIREMEAAEVRFRDSLQARPAADAELSAEARRFFERGTTLFRRPRPDYAGALQAFMAAYRFITAQGTAAPPEIVYNIALVHERMAARGPRAERERHAQEAADYFEEYLRQAPRGAPGRAEITERMRRLRQR